MDYNNPHLALEQIFSEFCSLTPRGRKDFLPKIEHVLSTIEIKNTDSYVSQKISSFREASKKMARLKQPKSYNESNIESWALGDISVIVDRLAE